MDRKHFHFLTDVCFILQEVSFIRLLFRLVKKCPRYVSYMVRKVLRNEKWIERKPLVTLNEIVFVQIIGKNDVP